MSITHLTDGWLYPIIEIPSITAPLGAEATADAIPVTPSGGMGTDVALEPPAIPTQTMATGEASPTAPCGTTGSDPTIEPPQVPEAPEASEDLGNETPGVPRCPQGQET